MLASTLQSGAAALAIVSVLSGCDSARDKADAKDQARDYVAQRQSAVRIVLPPDIVPGSKAAKTYAYWQTAAAIFSACTDIEQPQSRGLDKALVLQATAQHLGRLDKDLVDANALTAIGKLASMKNEVQTARREILQRPLPAASAASEPTDALDTLKQSALRQFAVYALAQMKIGQTNQQLEAARDTLHERYHVSLRPIVIDKSSCLTPASLLAG